MTIREFCTDFSARHQISFAALASALGYKSTNSLYRLMDETVRVSTLREFHKKMNQNWALSNQEKLDLQNAVGEKMYGTERSGIFQAMHRLIFEKNLPPEQERENGAFQLAERYIGCTDVQLTLFNSVNKEVIGAVQKMLERDAVVVHYFYPRMNVERRIRSVTLIAPVLFYPHYYAYLHPELTESDFLEELCGLSRADIAWCDFVDAKGKRQTETILVTQNGFRFLEELPRPEGLGLYLPIKKTWNEDGAMSDYVAFCRKCAELDRDRGVLSVKPDFCYGLISGDRMRELLQKGPMTMITNFPETLAELTDIFNKRFINNMEKKKHSWYVMKRTALERFMQTGRLSDHLWAMRPFMPEERREVFAEILSCCEKNPYIHLLLLKDDSFLMDRDVCLYEGEGLLLQPATTDYDLAGDYKEVLLTHPLIMHWFREYYMKVIVKNLCFSEKESMEILRSMV